MDTGPYILDVATLSPREVVTLEVGPTGQPWHIARVGRAPIEAAYVLGITVNSSNDRWAAIASGAHPFDVQITRFLSVGVVLYAGPQHVLRAGVIKAIWRNKALMAGTSRQ